METEESLVDSHVGIGIKTKATTSWQNSGNPFQQDRSRRPWTAAVIQVVETSLLRTLARRVRKQRIISRMLSSGWRISGGWRIETWKWSRVDRHRDLNLVWWGKEKAESGFSQESNSLPSSRGSRHERFVLLEKGMIGPLDLWGEI